jgi:hypothetical protein
MSTAIKRIPRDQRLRVTAVFSHETLQFGGNIFDFIQHLKDSHLTGEGTFRLNQGAEYGLEFDVRKLVPSEDGEIAIDTKP